MMRTAEVTKTAAVAIAKDATQMALMEVGGLLLLLLTEEKAAAVAAARLMVPRLLLARAAATTSCPRSMRIWTLVVELHAMGMRASNAPTTCKKRTRATAGWLGGEGGSSERAA